jgi:hypothetical protein
MYQDEYPLMASPIKVSHYTIFTPDPEEPFNYQAKFPCISTSLLKFECSVCGQTMDHHVKNLEFFIWIGEM